MTFNSYKRENNIGNNYLYNQGTGDKQFKTERITDLELNLDMTKLRMYDYALGRFISVDPLADVSPQESWSPYQYAFSNPVRYSDPNGEFPVIPFIVIGIAYLLDASFAEAPGTDQSPLAQQQAQETREQLRSANDVVTTIVNPGNGAKNFARKAVVNTVKNNKRQNTDTPTKGSEDAPMETSRSARRETMRDEGIPTSQQPTSQSKNQSGREYTYKVPKEGGGTQKKSVQQQTKDSSHKDKPHWEAGPVKTDESGEVRTNSFGWPKLQNDKSKNYYNP